jgi:hypothetical protein
MEISFWWRYKVGIIHEKCARQVVPTHDAILYEWPWHHCPCWPCNSANQFKVMLWWVFRGKSQEMVQLKILCTLKAIIWTSIDFLVHYL